MGKGLFIFISFILINITGWLFIWTHFEKYIPLEMAIQKVKINQWREGYKCQQFSEDLIKELDKAGIQANLILGEDEKTIKDPNVIHAWVGVWIEPQTGEFTTNYEKVDLK